MSDLTGLLFNLPRFNRDRTYLKKTLQYAPTIFYRMNADVDATIIDSSGNGLDGAYYNSNPDFGAGSFLDSSPVPGFTGDESAYCDALILENQFSWTGTWMQWVYIPSSSSTDFDQLMHFEHYTVDEGQSPDPNPCGLFLSKVSASQLRLRINRGTQVDTFFSFTADEWMFVAVTMNDTEAKLYINGELLATITGYGTNNIPIDYDWDWFIWGAVFTGNLVNCAYWKDVILSASDIADLAVVPNVVEDFTDPTIYFVDDEFITNAAAPLATPRSAEPIGTITLLTPSQISVNGNNLVFTNATSRAAVAHSGNRARQNGLALVTRAGQGSGSTHNIEVGVLDTSNNRLFYLSPRSGGGFITTNTDANYLNYYEGSEALLSLSMTRYAIIIHADGGASAFEYVGGSWKHIWREYSNTDANIRLAIWPWTLAGGNSTVLADYFRVGLLPAPFNGEWATVFAASPSGSYTGTGDQMLDIKVTAPGSITTEAGVRYRVRDSANYWRIYFNTSGALRVDSVENGVVTNRANVPGVISAGATRCVRVIMYGSTQRIFTATSEVWTQRASVVGNSTFSTETGIVIDVGAGWTVENLRAYRRTDPMYAALDRL